MKGSQASLALPSQTTLCKNAQGPLRRDQPCGSIYSRSHQSQDCIQPWHQRANAPCCFGRFNEMALCPWSAEHSQKTNGFPKPLRSLVPWWNSKSHEIIFIPYEFCVSSLSKFFNTLMLGNELSEKSLWFINTLYWILDCTLEFDTFILMAG